LIFSVYRSYFSVTFFFSFLHFISFLILIFVCGLRYPFPCPFAVSFVVSCSFFLRSYLSLGDFHIFCQHFCSFFPFSHTSFVLLLFCLSSSVSLHCHRMCSSVSFACHFVMVCGPTVTSSQSGYRHLIAPFQLLSVILPTRVLLSLFHCILPLFPT
jgi:hypothetical protein